LCRMVSRDACAPVADKPTPGAADLCFITRVSLAEVMAHLEACGVPIVAGPGPRAGAIGVVCVKFSKLVMVTGCWFVFRSR